jgi:TonB-linked SusC/RagA family outer membrane protein
MKLTLVFLSCLVIQSFAGVYSQTRINLNYENRKITDIFSDIQQQTGFVVVYGTSDLNPLREVSVSIKDGNINEVMEALLNDTDLIYTVIDDYIAILKAEKLVEERSSIQLKKITIKGKITDEEGIPLPGATIMEKGTTNGAITDIDGNYTLSVSAEKSILKISYIGFETQEVIIGAKITINVILKPSATSLDEVIITGYQNLSVNKSTGSVNVIKSEDIDKKGNSNIIQSLEGQVAGLGLFSDPTGEGKTKFNIRGITTLNGKTEPLIVVDGFPLEANISTVNPSDVESLTVLKDAAATSIYGSRAANGVIVITTKKGKKGKLQIDYRNTFTFSQRLDLAYRLNRLNSSDLVDIQTKLAGVNPHTYQWYLENTGRPKFTARNLVYETMAKANESIITDVQKKNILANLKTKDNTKQFEEYYLQPQSEMQHSLSISGGGDRNIFRVSLNYTRNKGPWTGSKSDRMIFDIANNYTISKNTNIDVITNIVFNNSNSIPIDESVVFQKTNSYEEIIDKNGNYLPVRLGYNINGNFGNGLAGFGGKDPVLIQNLINAGLLDETYYPLKELEQYSSKNKEVSVRLQARLNTKITKNLRGHFGFQYESASQKNENFSFAESFAMRQLINHTTPLTYSGDQNELNIPLGGRLVETKGNSNSYTLRGQLNFSKFFGDHEISSIMGSEIRQVFNTSTTLDRFGYNKNTLLFRNINKKTLEQTIRDVHYPNRIIRGLKFADNFTEITNRFFSLYGNFTYGYKNKYILSGSIRMDQSNLFGTDPSYRYKPFWSLGAKWRVSEESFFNIDAINSLSLRMSYGINGNISNKYGPFNIAKSFSPFLSGGISSLVIETPAIKDLRWERTKSFNIGLDLSMLNNRLTLGFDFYNKQTDDLLASTKTDPTLGFSNLISNDANINNKGVEVSLNTVNVQKGDFRWVTFLTFRYNKNKVTKAFTAKNKNSFITAGIMNKEGASANSFWLFDFQGLNAQGYPTITNSKGEVLIIDEFFNPSNVVSIKDLINAGTVEPVYTAALTNSINYKNLGLSFMFVGNAGHVLLKDSYNGEKQWGNAPSNINKDAANAWEKAGDEEHTNVPFIGSQNNASELIVLNSTKNIISGNYIRLRELIFTYSLPDNLLKNSYLKHITFNAKCTNLFFISKNKEGIDPEAHGVGMRYFPRKPSFSMGVHISF